MTLDSSNHPFPVFCRRMGKSSTRSSGIFSTDPPESAGLCSDWTAADCAPSHTDWLAQSSIANGWAGRGAHTGPYGNTWPKTQKKNDCHLHSVSARHYTLKQCNFTVIMIQHFTNNIAYRVVQVRMWCHQLLLCFCLKTFV